MANALTIAGSDSGGGAGIQADLKTFAAHGVYGLSVLTALTAQNTRAVSAVHLPPVDFVQAQLESVFSDISVDAVKIGMLANEPMVEAVADGLNRRAYKFLLLDPVMVAKSQARLLAPEAIASLKRRLIPMADLITPNIPEAAELLSLSFEEIAADMRAAAQALLSLGARAVLLKGGHLAGSKLSDILAYDSDINEFLSERIISRNDHGTGCTLGAAICANIASGHSLVAAIDSARSYLQAALRAADSLSVGSGHGPLCHHFALRSS